MKVNWGKVFVVVVIAIMTFATVDFFVTEQRKSEYRQYQETIEELKKANAEQVEAETQLAKEPAELQAEVNRPAEQVPLATNAGTGEPISESPAGPWVGPAD